jgi:two-component system sensor kinase FixL
LHDIAERLPDASQLLQQLTGAGVFEWSLDFTVPHVWSPALRRILGTGDDVPALGPEEFISRFVSPDDAHHVAQQIHAAGSPAAGSPAAGAWAAPSPVEIEFKIRRADGQPRVLRILVSRCISAQAGAPILLGVVSDETARRELEGDFSRFQDRLTDVARTAALGEMASGIAHELNQPLAAIATFAQAGERMLSRGNAPLDKAERIFRDIAAQALRGGDIIRHMRSLMRGRSAEHLEVDVAAVVRDMQNQFEVMSRAAGVPIRVEAGTKPAMVLADPVELQYVTLLFVQNATEAHRESNAEGCVTVTVTVQPPWVEVAVRDRGPGVAAENRGLLFKPFFTTKAHGTGLGLASGRALVDRYQGSIGFDAPHDGGSRFWFKIPCLPGSV